jgi:putative cardiolipin synthase
MVPSSRQLLCVVLQVFAGLCGGCVAIRTQVPRPISHSFAKPETTRLGHAFASEAARHPGESGFRILENGREALVARTALADAAEKTLDAQYYIYDTDAAGALLVQRMLAAAERGVHVRLLLDDNNLGEDKEMAALCAHPNVEVRVFNPFRFRARWARLPQYALDFNRMVRRMHTKIFVADNEVSIIGGRNVGNNYFNLDTASNFRDFDVLIVGSVTHDASAAFDEYWNSALSVPASALVARDPTPAEFDRLRGKLAARVKTIAGLELENAQHRASYVSELRKPDGLIWAHGEIIAEPPRKIQWATRENRVVSERLNREWDRTREELLIESSYFVPGNGVVEAFSELRERGVAVKVLTGALEATDVPLVYAAYKKYRRRLLHAGVQLFEYKGRPGPARSDRRWFKPRSSQSALHSKVIVFDRKRAWIGSFNIDPRSVKLNTEIAVLVDSEALASQLADYIAEDLSPERSWRVELEPLPKSYNTPRGRTADETLVWVGEKRGQPIKRHIEPASGWLERCETFLMSLIPFIEWQL